MKNASKAKKIALCAMVSALAIVFSAIEGALPQIPFLPPGAKLGLSNIVTMFAAGSMGGGYAVVVSLVKGGFAFITRGITAGLMSTAGGLMSAAVMWLLFKKTRLSISGVAILGALVHNMAQLCVAYLLTLTSVAFYIPFLVIFGILTGFVTGLVLKIVLPYVEKALGGLS